jgi:carbamoyl-phosphate synthase large subunit
MASTGEVGCFGETLEEALLEALLSTGFRYPERGVLLSLGPVRSKYRFSREAQLLAEMGLPLFATGGTHAVLEAEGVRATRVSKDEGDGEGPSALAAMREGRIDLVINVAREYDAQGVPDGALIRRLAVDLGIPLLTDFFLARAVVDAIATRPRSSLRARPWRHYLVRG